MSLNIFFFLILGAIVFEYGLKTVAAVLDLRMLSPKPPDELSGIYQEDEYRRSQDYLRTNIRFGLANGAFSLAVLLAFWFAGGFNRLDIFVRSLVDGPIASGLLYLGILGFAYMLIELPFQVYATFGIEQRFCFNRTSPRLFVLDRVKGIGLSLLLGGPLLSGVLALFVYGGPPAWLYCWMAVVAVSLFVQYILPIWILPLFNKFVPLESGELRKAILEYAREQGYPVKDIFVMDASRRSAKSNAFFTGFGRNRRVVLFDTLIAEHPVPELVAILAHEIGHYKRKHILQGTAISVLHAGLLLFLLSVFLKSPGLYEAFGVQGQPVYAGLLFFGLLYTPIELVLSIAMQAVSRSNEYEADRFAAATIANPGELVAALKRLSAKNLSNLSPHPLHVLLSYSHPPLLQRLRAIGREAGGH